MQTTAKAARTYVLGEFAEPSALIAAVAKLRAENAGELDAYSPFPLHGIDEALGLPRSKVPLMALCAGLTGAVSGYALQVFCNAVDYPINIANRPNHSFPTNIPITFELGILFTALSLFFGTIGYFFQMPRPHHPVFEVEEFRSASVDRYWVSIVGEKSPEEIVALRARLRELGANHISTVEEA